MANIRGMETLFGGRPCSTRNTEAWRNFANRTFNKPQQSSTAPPSTGQARSAGVTPGTSHCTPRNQTLMLSGGRRAPSGPRGLNSSGNSSAFVHLQRGLSSTSRPGRSTDQMTSSGGRHPPTTPGSRSRGLNASMAVDAESHCIVAIFESNNRTGDHEVGMAAIDLTRPYLYLCQLSDSQLYSNTLAKINVYNPTELLLPYSLRKSEAVGEDPLTLKLREQYPQVTINTVQRRHFSDALGLKLIETFCTSENSNVQVLVARRFYAQAAAAALMKYVEYIRNMLFVPKSLRVEYQGSNKVMVIDVDTAERLELVRGVQAPLNVSLLSTLSHCRTAGGLKLLRSWVLQPSCDLPLILQRQDCVQELVDNPGLFHSLQSVLPRFVDCQQLLGLSMTCVAGGQGATALRNAEMQLNYVLRLKSCFDSLLFLQEVMAEAKAPLFCSYKKCLEEESFVKLRKMIDEKIHCDAHAERGFGGGHVQRCFAVKTGTNGLLDVARKMYCELVDKITTLVNKYKEDHSIPVRVGFSCNRGFHIQIPLSGPRVHLRESELPQEFIQIQKTRSTMTATTQELVSLDYRCKETLADIELMSNTVVKELLSEVRQHADALYSLIEAVTHLDVLCSLACVSALQGYVRPSFGSRLKLKASHHPVLCFISPNPTVPNDVFASSEKNFNIITGPNMGGKSIYIRQVALLQILAQMGCFVPADSAMVRIADRLFARIGFDDSLESNASTFTLEMREIQMLLKYVTPSSVVVVDELCRGTCCEEGTSLAWAICENLLDMSAFTFFTTHFHLLTKLASFYPNIINSHMEVVRAEIQEEDEANNPPQDVEEASTGLRYTHRLLPGVFQLQEYGLEQSSLSNMPKSILKRAREILRQLQGEDSEIKADFEVLDAGCQDNMAWMKLKSALEELSKDLEDSNLVQKIKELQEKYHYLLDTLPPLGEISLNSSQNSQLIHKAVSPPRSDEAQNNNSHISEQRSHSSMDIFSPKSQTSPKINLGYFSSMTEMRTMPTPLSSTQTPQLHKILNYGSTAPAASPQQEIPTLSKSPSEIAPMLSINPVEELKNFSDHTEEEKASPVVPNQSMIKIPEASVNLVPDEEINMEVGETVDPEVNETEEQTTMEVAEIDLDAEVIGPSQAEGGHEDTVHPKSLLNDTSVRENLVQAMTENGNTEENRLNEEQNPETTDQGELASTLKTTVKHSSPQVDFLLMTPSPVTKSKRRLRFCPPIRRPETNN